MKRLELLILILILIFAFTLRIYKITSNPPGLYWDEAALGYDAYSILKTAKDHHGQFLPLFFESFGDWKLPVYFYLLVPLVAILGLSEFAVRLPSVIFATLTILVFFMFIKELTKNRTLALLGALFLSVSPWHIQFTRAAFEASVGLFFLLLGIYLGARALNNLKSQNFFVPFVFLALSMYTYHAYRIFTPLLIVSVVIVYSDQIRNSVKKLVYPAILFLILITPLIIFSFSPHGRERAAATSAFSEKEFRQEELDYNQKSLKPLRFLSGYLYQPPIYYLYLASTNYLDHFSPIFLFFNGDSQGRHSQIDMGQIYGIDAVFLAASLFAVKKLKKSTLKLIVFWLLIAVIPTVFVVPVPHALRTLQIAIPLTFFLTLGFYQIFTNKKLFSVQIILAVVFLYSFASYLHLLFIHYPKKFALDWQDGYRVMVEEVKKYQDNFDKIYITNVNSVPYIYLLFYLQYDPTKFIAEKGNQESFDKYIFVSRDANIYNEGKILYVAPTWEKVDGNLLSTVVDNAKRPVFSLWEVGGKD